MCFFFFTGLPIVSLHLHAFVCKAHELPRWCFSPLWVSSGCVQVLKEDDVISKEFHRSAFSIQAFFVTRGGKAKR